MFQNQIIDEQCITIFNIYFSLKLKLSSFVLFLECLHERLKTFIDIFLNIE